MKFRSLLVFSMLLRVFLIVYGEWQDAHMEVRYTDVDYIVFSDAASLMASGESPYKRTTYRYSPLLALLLTPNSFFHRSWGKFLFSASGMAFLIVISSFLCLLCLNRRKLVESSTFFGLVHQPHNVSMICFSVVLESISMFQIYWSAGLSIRFWNNVRCLRRYVHIL